LRNLTYVLSFVPIAVTVKSSALRVYGKSKSSWMVTGVFKTGETLFGFKSLLAAILSLVVNLTLLVTACELMTTLNPYSYLA